MDLQKDIVPIISKIIENAKTPTIFTNKCIIVVSILESMKEAIINFSPESEIGQPDLESLQNHFLRLFETIRSFKKENFFWSICKNGQSFQQTVKNINDIMGKINLTLNKIGIKQSFSLPGDELFNDLDELDNFLRDTLHVIEQRRKEVQDLFKQIHTARSNINSISTDEDNIEELKKYPQFQVSKADFTINPNIIDKNAEFYYYKGVKKSNNQNVTILKLLDNKIFKRLLSVLISIEHPYVEAFIGAYIEDKKITIVTNRDGFRLRNLLLNKDQDDQFQLKSGDRTILAFKIAQAMAYLHSRSVIHRNLNTSRIFITQKMNDENQIEVNPTIVGFRDSCVQQADFSIQMSEISSQKSSIFKGFEQDNSNSNSNDEMIDVFAFGGILYEMLTNSPFQFDDSSSISDLLKEKRLPQLPDDTPENLRKLIEKCWSTDPDDRYSFDNIVDKMIKKQIIFQNDIENVEMIEKFYEKNSIKSVSAKKCLDIFDSIKKSIGKTYQYRFEFLRIRPIINDYNYLLKTSKYSNKDELTNEEKENMESLSKNLKALTTIIANQSENKWSEILKKSSKAKTLIKNLKITEVTKEITNTMENIYESMKNLGFDDIDKYVEVDDDLVFDYNELQSILEDYVDVLGAKIIDSKLQEITHFRVERKLDGTISKESLHQRIKDLFAPFKEEYEIDINNYQSKSNHYFINELREDDFKGSEIFLFVLSKEIRYLARLKHKYICEFVGFSISEKDNVVWFVSKFVNNGSLFHSIVTESRLSGDEKTKIAFQIAQAMNYIHQKQILHLDLKTENVLLDGETPKLVNFRFKKKCDMKNNTISLGTVNYMAPEILKGDKFDSKADVFSFAMLLYEMYHEKPPFAQFSLHSEVIKKKILRGVELSFNDDIQNELKHLIEDCCQMDSRKRPSFKAILNRMKTENIVFPGANNDLIKTFYNDEIAKMELESKSLF